MKHCIPFARVRTASVSDCFFGFCDLRSRSHQLRIHAAMPPPLGLGAPILGEFLYPNPDVELYEQVLESMTSAQDDDGGVVVPSQPLLLHACRLAFTLPGSRQLLEFTDTPYWNWDSL